MPHIRVSALFLPHLLSCKHNLYVLGGQIIPELHSGAKAFSAGLCEAWAAPQVADCMNSTENHSGYVMMTQTFLHCVLVFPSSTVCFLSTVGQRCSWMSAVFTVRFCELPRPAWNMRQTASPDGRQPGLPLKLSSVVYTQLPPFGVCFWNGPSYCSQSRKSKCTGRDRQGNRGPSCWKCLLQSVFIKVLSESPWPCVVFVCFPAASPGLV